MTNKLNPPKDSRSDYDKDVWQYLRNVDKLFLRATQETGDVLAVDISGRPTPPSNLQSTMAALYPALDGTVPYEPARFTGHLGPVLRKGQVAPTFGQVQASTGSYPPGTFHVTLDLGGAWDEVTATHSLAVWLAHDECPVLMETDRPGDDTDLVTTQWKLPSDGTNHAYDILHRRSCVCGPLQDGSASVSAPWEPKSMLYKLGGWPKGASGNMYELCKRTPTQEPACANNQPIDHLQNNYYSTYAPRYLKALKWKNPATATGADMYEVSKSPLLARSGAYDCSTTGDGSLVEPRCKPVVPSATPSATSQGIMTMQGDPRDPRDREDLVPGKDGKPTGVARRYPCGCVRYSDVAQRIVLQALTGTSNEMVASSQLGRGPLLGAGADVDGEIQGGGRGSYMTFDASGYHARHPTIGISWDNTSPDTQAYTATFTIDGKYLFSTDQFVGTRNMKLFVGLPPSAKITTVKYTRGSAPSIVFPHHRVSLPS